MRSDRKKERAENKQNAKKNRFYRILAVIYTLLVVVFAVQLVMINVLPAKYLYPILAVLIAASLFIVPVMYSKNGKKGRKRVATVFALGLLVVFGVGIYYAGETLSFFNSITDIGKAKEDFHVVVLEDSRYEEASDLSGKTVAATTTTDKIYSKAKNELKDQINVKYEYVETNTEMMNGLLEGNHEAIFISAGSYETMQEGNATIGEKTRILYTVSVTKESTRKAKNVDVEKEPFNILISGLDVTGDIGTVSRSDVNMVVTVNPVTHEVLLTSIPRDSYVTLPSKDAKDKLTHSGLYGIEETIGAVEEFMGIDINYYVKVNYSTVVKLVDAIGGIDIDSPYAFTTHGMKAHYTFSQGYNHLDGNMALAYSRERYSFADGDMRRNENQQIIIEAIIKKASRSKTLMTEYASILNAVEDNLSTDMGKKEIKAIAKMQLRDMPEWKIEKQAVKGLPGTGFCYALGMNASIVTADEVMIVEAVDKIMEVQGHED